VTNNNNFQISEIEINLLRDSLKLSNAFIYNWDCIKDELIIYAGDFEGNGIDRGHFHGTLAEVTGRFLHPSEVVDFLNFIDKFRLSDSATFTVNFRMFNPAANEYVWYKDWGRAIRDENGKCVSIFGTFININNTQQQIDNLKEQVLQSEESIKSLFYNSTQLMFLFDKNYKLIDCNDAIMNLFSFKDKEDAFANCHKALKVAIMPIQENGRPAVSIIERIDNALKNGIDKSASWLEIEGRKIKFDITYIRIVYQGDYAVACYGDDTTILSDALLTSEKNSNIISEQNKELKRYEKYLIAMNAMAVTLFSNQSFDWKTNVVEALKIAKEVTNSTRVGIWRNFIEDDEMFAMRMAHTDDSEIINVKLSYSAYLPDWNAENANKKYVSENIENFPYTLLGKLAAKKLGAKHMTMVPIVVSGEFWGIFVIIYDTPDHNFSSSEINILRQAGLNCANAVLITERSVSLMEASKAKSQFLS
jgi:PAS domain-containing protein